MGLDFLGLGFGNENEIRIVTNLNNGNLGKTEEMFVAADVFLIIPSKIVSEFNEPLV